MLQAHGTLMSSQQPAFHQGSHTVDSRHQLHRRGLAPLQNRHLVSVAFCLQTRIAVPTIGVHPTAWCDGLFQELVQGSCRGVGDPSPAGCAPCRDHLVRKPLPPKPLSQSGGPKRLPPARLYTSHPLPPSRATDPGSAAPSHGATCAATPRPS